MTSTTKTVTATVTEAGPAKRFILRPWGPAGSSPTRLYVTPLHATRKEERGVGYVDLSTGKYTELVRYGIAPRIDWRKLYEEA